MNNITILHLSDLHIVSSTAKKISELHRSLINDISKQLSSTEDNSVIVAVTGDIIHQAPAYSQNKNGYNNALMFFEDLYNKIQSKVKAIYIVPGNHDKLRTNTDRFLISSYRSMINNISIDQSTKKLAYSNQQFNSEFYKNIWPIHRKAYSQSDGSGFIELVENINHIFKTNDINNKKYLSETYGVDSIEINGISVCFVMLNTAWSCIDDIDNRQIILGEFQIDEIRRQYYDLSSHKYTIVLGHHPISALQSREEDVLFSNMISSHAGLNANIYLCGHTHDRGVANSINNDHSINTFVTGIGWPESINNRHVAKHTYSIYKINPSTNSIDIKIRSTADSGDFKDDEDIPQSSKFVPLISNKTQSYIPLNYGDDSYLYKVCFNTKDFIEYIPKYIKFIERFRQLSATFFEEIKGNFLNEIKKQIPQFDVKELQTYSHYFLSGDDDSDPPTSLDEIFKKPEIINFSHKNFLGFLAFMCRKMELLLHDIYESSSSNEDIVRFHFRYLSERSSHTYKQLCQNYISSNNNLVVSDIKYCDLIQLAHSRNKSLIYSINSTFTKTIPLKEKWHNFITIVPLFQGNEYSTKAQKKYPFLTFGVTVNSAKYDMFLFCLDYLSFKETIENILGVFVEFFHIDMNSFCKYAKEELETGGAL